MKEGEYMKNILTGLLITILSAPAFAGSVSGGLNYGSDYIFRGMSQSGKPTAGAWLQLDSDLGFYAGAWGSQVDFSSMDSSETSQEVDYYGGYNLQVSDSVSVDMGYQRLTFNGLTPSVEEFYSKTQIGNLGIDVYQDLETNDNYAEISYAFGWLFDNAFDASLMFGTHDRKGDDSFTMLRLGKSFGSQNQFNFGVLVGQNVFEGQVADSITARLSYNFKRSNS